MSDATVDDEEVEVKKPSKLPLIIGVVLALAGGGGGFYAVQSGLLGIGGSKEADYGEHAVADSGDPHVETKALPDVAFVEVPPVVISLGPNAQSKHLQFRASLEVPSEYRAEVEGILPRVQDVLNSYLRALEARDLEAQGALVKLRGQMLRRVRLVAGEGRVRDLLVLEFVLN
ncbi:flagellar basal body-associated FliL family protein [Antarctobacter jejuensis]|uniref:flagellar basal body-associated FliL family protein n=1 Tax=Antarctobacter jejuensis TaxID=1439938 RepID=UPI003FD4F3ED